MSANPGTGPGRFAWPTAVLWATFAWSAAVLAADAPKPARDTGEPDAADRSAARANRTGPRPAASRPDQVPADRPLREDEILAALPMQWTDPQALAVAAVAVNRRLKQFDDRKQPFPWALADGFRKSLLNGRGTADKIEPEVRVAYWQAAFMASMAAGHPTDALTAARELIKLNVMTGWNYLALYRAGMLCGDKAACTEALERMKPLIDPQTLEGLTPLIWQAELVGTQPVFEVALFDGTKFSPGLVRGQVVVIDFWVHGLDTYTRIIKKIKELHATFKDYPGFKMVGVNWEAPQFRAVVNAFIQANDITWPQVFEGRQPDRPLSLKVFKVRLVPSLIVLSPTGTVIFQGQPDEPALYYAIRTGLLEANAGRIPTSQPAAAPAQVVRPFMPGSTPTPIIRPPVKLAPAAGGPKPAAPAAPGKAEREKAAWELLNLAYAYEKADLKEKALELYKQVLAKYPDSDAAVKARARLETEY